VIWVIKPGYSIKGKSEKIIKQNSRSSKIKKKKQITIKKIKIKSDIKLNKIK
jgi:hypothetical protein